MKLFGSISVKWKIYAIALVSLIGFAGYLGFNVIVNTNNAELLSQVRDLHYPVLDHSKSNREQIDRINEMFNTAVVIADIDFVYDAENLAKELNQAFDEAALLAPHDRDEISAIKADFADYLNRVVTLSADMVSGDIDFDQLADLAANKEAALKKVTDRQEAYIAYVLEKFKAGIRQANENSETLLRSGFILWLVNVFILAVTSFAIARVILTNIVSVSTSLEEIAKGEGNLDDEIAVSSSDEIGQLAISFNHLMARLRERTNDIMSMMQNMHQGLFTIMADDEQLIIHPEYAAFIETIFETKDIAGKTYDSLLFSKAQLGSNERDQIVTAVSSIIKEDAMMFEFNSHLLPAEIITYFPDRRESARDEFGHEGKRLKILELEWDPIIANDIVDKIMVTVRDVTALRAAAAEAEAQKAELEIIGQILHVSPSKFDAFFDNAKRLLAENRELINANENGNPDIIADLFANMHTIKGNTRTYGFNYITDVVHDAETTYDTLRKSSAATWHQTQLLDELVAVESAIQRYGDIKHNKLSFDFSDQATTSLITLSEECYQQLRAQCNELETMGQEISCRSTLEQLTRSIRRLGTAPLSEVISGLTESLPSIALQLNKAPPIIEIDGKQLGFKTQYHELLVNIFTHLLRNSIDHGLETREERKEKQKHPQGTIHINIDTSGTSAIITLNDDGKGLALARIKAKALEEGNTSLTERSTVQDIANLLFESGISTAEALTDISGRGVGMDAVRKFLNQNDADISVELIGTPSLNDEYVPFRLKLTLPGTMYED